MITKKEKAAIKKAFQKDLIYFGPLMKDGKAEAIWPFLSKMRGAACRLGDSAHVDLQSIFGEDFVVVQIDHPKAFRKKVENWLK